MHPTLLLAVIYAAFISLGLPDAVMGVAWPTLRSSLGAPLAAAGPIAIVLTCLSAFSAACSGPAQKRLGTGWLVMLSCVMTALGLLGYSYAPSYAWLLLAALPLGLGQGAVDASLNSYVAAHCASRHMNWLHASWGIGALTGPIVMSQAFAWGFDWRDGYGVLALIQGCLAILLLMTVRLWPREVKERAGETSASVRTLEKISPTVARRMSGLKRPEPWIQIGLYALYSASEFAIGIWAASLLVDARGVSLRRAGTLLAIYYAGITLGRILTGLVSDRVGNKALVRWGLATSFCGAWLFAASAWTSAWLPGLLLLGLGFAPIYPSLMHETPRRFDAPTAQTVIGLQVGAACLGASVFPSLLGLAAAATTLEILAPSVGLAILIMAWGSERLNRI